MHLVDDEYLVASGLWWNLYLFDERPDVVDGVVGCRVEFVDVQRPPFVECHAAFALVACLSVLSGTEAVDGFSKDACAGGLAHASRAAEEVGMRQFPRLDGILQRGGKGALPHYGIESRRAVFAGRYNII